MADNPFTKISDLNNWEFTEAVFDKVFEFPNPSGGEAMDGTKIYPKYVFGTEALVPGKVTVVSSEYKAGYPTPGQGTADYILPTFGAIQFENILHTTGPMNGEPKIFYIHGFSEKGLLLSPTELIGEWGYINENGSYAGGASIWSFNQAYVLSPTGFTYAGALYSNPDGFPSYAQDSGMFFDKDPTVLAVPVCFAEGTRIETMNGSVAVEDLSIGDQVLTVSGETRAIVWIGDMIARPARHSRPQAYNPVCVMPHAFGENMPVAPVRLSPGHAVHVDGVLVPVGKLVNGATIIQEEVDSVHYYHVELDEHDVILAEGLHCESYFDDGNRSSFRNASGFATLHGRLDPQSWDRACAPMVADGPQLAAIRKRLHKEAMRLGWQRIEESGLMIEADGVAIPPSCQQGGRYGFTIPAANLVTLRSNCGILAQTMPGINDQRMLGVAVSRLSIEGTDCSFDDAVFGDGFHAPERGDAFGWRWTDGAATLVLGGRAVSLEIDLAMIVPSWRRPSSTSSLVIAA